MASVTAVLFDFGMVLSGPPDPPTWEKMKQLAGSGEQEFYRAFWMHRDDYDRGTLTGEAYWQQVAATLRTTFTAVTVQELMRLDVDLWTQMNGPMVAWVRQLHRAGVRTGILSNMGDAMAEAICNKFDWIGDFHHTIWSHALKLRKPEEAIYLAAAEGLGVPADQILFIDDKQENVDAAEQAGMQGLTYSEHSAFEAEMEERGFSYLLHPVGATT